MIEKVAPELNPNIENLIPVKSDPESMIEKITPVLNQDLENLK